MDAGICAAAGVSNQSARTLSLRPNTNLGVQVGLSAYRDRRFDGNQEEYEICLKQSTTVYVGNLSFYTTEEQVRPTTVRAARETQAHPSPVALACHPEVEVGERDARGVVREGTGADDG